MDKFSLLFGVATLFIVPIWAAKDPNPRRGLKRALFGVVAANVVYLLLLRFVAPRYL